MITVKLEGAKEMVSALKRMRTQAVPFALRNALNTAAFETRTIWQRQIRTAFTNRNAFTERSIRVEQASPTNLVAKVGSVADYMGTQEDGGTVKGKSGHKVIAAPGAAGQAAGGQRKRAVRARFYLGGINVAHPSLHGGRRQQNAIAIAVARKQGKNIVLLTRPGGRKGLFLIGGGKRALRTKLLYDVSKSSVKVPGSHTLQSSLAAVKPKLEHMLEASVKQQMQRFNVGR